MYSIVLHSMCIQRWLYSKFTSLCANSTVKQSLSLRACIGQNVELYNLSMSYLAASPTITVLTPSWMSAYILHARMHAHSHAHPHTCANPSINKKNSESFDTLLIQAKICVCCYVTIGYSDRCITSTFLFCQVGGGIVKQQ